MTNFNHIQAFIKDMRRGGSLPVRRLRYPEMVLVWEQIFAAVRKANEGAEIYAAESYVQIW